ncbi:MAG TPA: PQQ-binding-like beta-propeller repeat protein, partial [Humisphaera sp.]|nr:PQQ-binding-like beta-propeller repeat protein [Humisphaera sp.]
IYVTAPIDGKDAVESYDWSGKSLWQTAIGPQRPGKSNNGSGCNPSPTTDGKNLFVYFKSGNFAALDLSGKILWQTNLQERYGKDTLYWDIGTSPVLTDKAVIIAVMHHGGSYLAAFDKLTGDVHWKVAREYSTPTEGDHSYATPIVYRQDGKEAILVWGAEHLTAHDPNDGHILWSCGGFNPDHHNNWVCVASAVICGEIAVVPYGRNTQLHGIKLGGEGDVTASARLWERTDTGSFCPTPAAYKGRVYLLRDRGEIDCIDPITGKTEWEGKLPKKSSSYYSSPTVADGKIYAAREDGMLFVAKVDGGFELLSQNDMGERLIASPVPVGDRLLIRGETHLFCVGE